MRMVFSSEQPSSHAAPAVGASCAMDWRVSLSDEEFSDEPEPEEARGSDAEKVLLPTILSGELH